jgi:phospholipid/cholesterol/gamma-HCH transport system permease protein
MQPTSKPATIVCMSEIVEIITGAGAWITQRLQTGFAMSRLFFDTVRELFLLTGKRRLSPRQLVNQVLFTGVDAFFLIGLIGLLCGVIITIQAKTNMPKIGVSEYFGTVMVIALVRELGPFFTALVVIGRSGAALAAYLGNMRVNKEIAALEVMGVNLVNFLVLPAFIGMILSMVCLTVYFDCIGIVGGLLFAKLLVNLDFFNSLASIGDALTWVDIVVSVGKNLAFGAVIAVVSCYHGLSVDSSVRIVPRAVFRAVVSSMVIVMVVDVAITVGFYVK